MDNGTRVIGDVGFLLLPGFSLLAMSSALEPLRMANQLSGRPLYTMRVFGPRGEEVTASCGLRLATGDPAEAAAPDLLLVCAGVDVQARCEPVVLQQLRRFARAGSALGAVCTGGYVLARAGLLKGRRCTLHWEQIPGIHEGMQFPDVRFTRELFVIDGDRYTCSGGTAPLDMMLNVIARGHGVELAEAIAEEFLHEHIRDAGDRQRAPLWQTQVPAKLREAVALMEANLHEPLSPEQLAAAAGLSRRQLERLFRRELGRAPTRHYVRLRLAQSRRLLQQTDMPVGDVALACGFVSAPHFTRAYRQRYGCSPTDERRRHRDRLLGEESADAGEGSRGAA